MSKNVSRLFWLSVILIVASCAPRVAEKPPAFEGRDVREAISARKAVSSIETVFSIAFEKKDSEMKGDGALTISRNGDMSLRIYSLGFLAVELTSSDGVVKSSPRIDKNKTVLLTEGLKDCLFWWDMKDYTIEEDADCFVLRNGERVLWIDKKTLLPLKQKIFFDADKELNIYYEEPARENDLWYQSKIRIEIPRYSIKLTVKKMAFKTEPSSMEAVKPASSGFILLDQGRRQQS
jgi:hypothetical protein